MEKSSASSENVDLMGVTSSEELSAIPSVVPALTAGDTSPGDVHLEEEMIDVQDVETSLTTSITDSLSVKDVEETSKQVPLVTSSEGPAKQKVPNICGDSSDDESTHSNESKDQKSLVTVKGPAPKPKIRRQRSYSRSDSESGYEDQPGPSKMSKMSEQVEDVLASLVANASLTPAAAEEKTWAEPKKVVHRREDTERRRKDAHAHREYESFSNHPFADLLKPKLAPVESSYYNTNLDEDLFERIPSAGYSGLVEGLFPEVIGGVPRSLRSKVTILEAVGPEAIESFRERHRYTEIEVLRANEQPLPTMAKVEQASKEELTKEVHGLVFDGEIKPVLYRIEALFGNGARLQPVHFEIPLPDRLDLFVIQIDPFAINIVTGKRGIDPSKMMVGDLLWVYTLAVTVRFQKNQVSAPRTIEQACMVRESTVWRVDRFALIHRELVPTLGFVVSTGTRNGLRVCMQGHRRLVSITKCRMENPEEFHSIETNSFIVAPFRARQLDYMVFACEPKNSNELSAYIAEVPYHGSPPPLPFNVRRTSNDHRELVESKLANFELFRSSPGEVLQFLEPLYSTACGAISATIMAAMDLTVHSVVWESPDINAFPVVAKFSIPISRKTGWAVGRTIKGAFMSDILEGQITHIEMGTEFFEVKVQLQTTSGVRFRTYLINSRSMRISVGTSLHTMEERANPVLKMLDASVLSNLFHPGTFGWNSARALIAGDIDLEGIESPERERISVNVAGTPVELNPHQVNAVNTFNKNFPMMVVDSAYGAGKSLCTAVMALEAVNRDEVILVAAVQNSALDVIGSKIAQLQTDSIRPVRYVNDIMAADPSTASPYALNTLMENFHRTHGHLLNPKLHRKFRQFSESRQEMRDFHFTGTERQVISSEHKKLLILEQNSSEQVKILASHFLRLYKPNVYLCTIAAALNLTSKKGLWRTIGNSWKCVLLDEASMIPEAALMAMLSRFQNARFTLIGDSKQLPPYIGVHTIPLAVEVSSRSVLDVAHKNGNVPICTVSTVYRPHVEMMNLNSELFYEGSLVCGTPRNQRQGLLARMRMPNARIPVALVNVASHSTKSITGSHSNEVEANAALVLVRHLLAVGMRSEDILVTCLYRDQKFLCQNRLQATGVTVGTVDSAQGSERSVVILCTTRTQMETRDQQTFFSDAKRLNVALSRGKDGLFILGSVNFLQDVHTWSAIVRWCRRANVVTDLHFFDSQVRPMLRL